MPDSCIALTCVLLILAIGLCIILYGMYLILLDSWGELEVAVKGTSQYSEKTYHRPYISDKAECLCGNVKRKKSQRCVKCSRQIWKLKATVRPAVDSYVDGKSVTLKLGNLHENWRVSAHPVVVALIEALLDGADGELRLVQQEVADG